MEAFRNGESSYITTVYDGDSGELVGKTFTLNKKILVVEGVFMFHPELALSKFWDKRIYLHGDISQIDERRVKREKERWGDKYFPETHPDSYFRAVTTGLKRYIDLHKPQEAADLSLRVDF